MRAQLAARRGRTLTNPPVSARSNDGLRRDIECRRKVSGCGECSKRTRAGTYLRKRGFVESETLPNRPPRRRIQAVGRSVMHLHWNLVTPRAVTERAGGRARDRQTTTLVSLQGNREQAGAGVGRKRNELPRRPWGNRASELLWRCLTGLGTWPTGAVRRFCTSAQTPEICSPIFVPA